MAAKQGQAFQSLEGAMDQNGARRKQGERSALCACEPETATLQDGLMAVCKMDLGALTGFLPAKLKHFRSVSLVIIGNEPVEQADAKTRSPALIDLALR